MYKRMAIVMSDFAHLKASEALYAHFALCEVILALLACYEPGVVARFSSV